MLKNFKKSICCVGKYKKYKIQTLANESQYEILMLSHLFEISLDGRIPEI